MGGCPMGSTTHRGRGAADAGQAGGGMGLEGWGRRRGGWLVGMVVVLTRTARTLRDEPCRWCLRSAPYLAGGVLFAFRHQIAALLGL